MSYNFFDNIFGDIFNGSKGNYLKPAHYEFPSMDKNMWRFFEPKLSNDELKDSIASVLENLKSDNVDEETKTLFRIQLKELLNEQVQRAKTF